jgi:hypothetical protein
MDIMQLAHKQHALQYLQYRRQQRAACGYLLALQGILAY